MFQFVRPVRGLALVAGLWLCLGVAIEVITPRQLGELVNTITGLNLSSVTPDQGFVAWLLTSDGPSAAVRNAALQLMGLVAAGALVSYLRTVATTRLSMDMVYHIREATYDKLQHAGFAFHDTISTGQLINRSLTDLQNVRAFLQTFILTVLEIVLIVGGFIVLLLTRQPWVALIALVPLPLWTWYILRFSRKVQPVVRAAVEAGDRNVQLITENIAGVHVIKAFAAESAEITRYNRNCDRFFVRIRRRIRLFANFNPVIRGIATAAQLALALATSVMILRGTMTVGDFLIVGLAMSAILTRLQQVAAVNDQYQNAIVSARRLYEILAAQPAVDEKPDAPPLPPGNGQIVVENVTFGYAPAKPILRDVSFAVPAGSVVALVGPTGAGKSTLVNLLARFYDPQTGRILIDGVDIRDVRLASLRTQITYVFQETFLFSDTVANNIAYGKPDASEGEIEIAARLAQAHEFIEALPNGYQSILAERGSSLSGGQRQRLAIARAILNNPRVLVLDDATAAVDPETEDLIRRGLRHVLRGCTTFVIAHRLSTAKAADLVVVIEEGRITQMGTHEQLLKEDGHYREIAAVQLYSDAESEAERSPSHMKRIKSRQTFVAAAQPQATLPPTPGEETVE